MDRAESGLRSIQLSQYSMLGAFFQGEVNDAEGVAGNRRDLRTDLRAASAGDGLPVKGSRLGHIPVAKKTLRAFLGLTGVS